MAKILLVTDAWKPQVNGVVTTLTNLVHQARKHGDTIHVYHPGRCKIRFPLPFYKEITIGIPFPCGIRDLLKRQKWDHIHIATPEAPVGLNFVRTCKRLKIPFSTSLHTLFPEFVEKRIPVLKSNIGWKYMHKVYDGSTHILTTTKSMVKLLKDKGFKQEIRSWSRGVDRSVFKPSKTFRKTDEHYLLCVSRVSHEKGLDDFCELEYPNAVKIVVGDGPYLKTLKKKYPDVHFVGKKVGDDLARYYQHADVFVFPSKVDTFGVVQIEAMACGTPVAAYPVVGPIDIIKHGYNGYMEDNLESAVRGCLHLDRKKVLSMSKKWTWENCYKQFRDILLNVQTQN